MPNTWAMRVFSIGPCPEKSSLPELGCGQMQTADQWPGWRPPGDLGIRDGRFEIREIWIEEFPLDFSLPVLESRIPRSGLSTPQGRDQDDRKRAEHADHDDERHQPRRIRPSSRRVVGRPRTLR